MGIIIYIILLTLLFYVNIILNLSNYIKQIIFNNKNKIILLYLKIRALELLINLIKSLDTKKIFKMLIQESFNDNRI